MAISPVVNSFMQQDQQQGPVDAAQIFKNQFTDMAFNALRAKFPALINNVVTLKHLASDVEKGTVFGVFVIQSGNDLVYVPVVMADGSIVSCEMIYDKEADQFYPLDSHSAKEIITNSKSSDPVILQNNPRVEDTRRLFQSMVRPPTSSNVILASQRDGVSGLPDNLKEKVCKYLETENPRLLGKVASFYDVGELALKLSPTGQEKEAHEKVGQSFVRLDRLTKEAAATLSLEDKKVIRKQGYIIKKAENKPTLVVNADAMQKAVETELHLSLYTPETACPKHGFVLCRPDYAPVGYGEIIQCTEKGIEFVPVLVSGYYLFGRDNSRYRIDENTGVLIKDLSFESIDFSAFPHLVSIDKLRQEISQNNRWVSIDVFVPARKGARVWVATGISGMPDEINITDDRISAYGNSIQLSEKLSLGYLWSNSGVVVVPCDTLFMARGNGEDKTPLAPVSSFEKLLKLMKVFGVALSTADNGAGININTPEKTASFASEIDAAEWLHGNFGMDSCQIKTVLDNPKTLVFAKSAFLDPDPEMMQGMPDPYAPESAAMVETPESGEFQDAPPPDFAALEDFAELEDPAMFDTGILASFAQYPDAKTLLVEYMPDFLAAEDKIGRVLLLFCSQKKEIEEFYGSEKCSTLIASLRRIFGILGELVASLKLYINMV